MIAMFNHRLRYYFIFTLSFLTFVVTELCNVYYFFQIEIEWYLAFATIFLVTLFTWECSRLLYPLVNKYLPAHWDMYKKLGAFFVVGSTAMVLSTIPIVWFIGVVLGGFPLSKLSYPLKLNIIYGSLINILFHLIHTVVFYFNEYKIKLLEAETLKQASSAAELQVIKNQINPHFLFNNLNVLSTLILQNHNEANKFIEEFSKVYRHILKSTNQELILLKEEMDFIKPYIFLLQKRFPIGLQIEINIAAEYYDRYIIPASLQLLIENAIKHNVATSSRPLQIKIFVENNFLVVYNNLQKRKYIEFSSQMGLRNIARRYELLTRQAIIIIENEQAFKVAIPIVEIEHKATTSKVETINNETKIAPVGVQL
jgi:two-component system, LytTR family, sensor kinase